MSKFIRPIGHPTCVLLLCAGSVLSLAGCADESPSARAVKDAANQVQSSGISSITPEDLATGTRKGASGLTQVSQGDSGEAMSAILLTAQADLAQAEADAGAITPAEGLIRSNLALLSERSSQWANYNAVGTAAAAFNPARDLADFTKQKSDRQKDLAEWTAKRSTLTSQLTDLEARSKTELDAAKAIFDQASQLTQRASSMSARDAVALIEQSADLRKQGDVHRVAGETLLAQIDSLKPQLAEANVMVNQFEAQITALDRAVGELSARKSESQQTDTQAQADAGRIASQIDALVNELMKAHDETYLPAFTKATGGFNKVVSATRKAQGDKPSSGGVSAARITSGSAQISIAGLHYGRAQLLDSMIGTLDVLSKASPALPAKADFDARINALTELRKSSVDEASKALQEAQSSMQGVQIQGPTRERMQQLGELIGKLDKVVKGEALDLSGKAPPPKLDADGIPVAAKEMVAKLIDLSKAKDFAGAAAMMHAETDNGKKLVELQSKVSEGIDKLETALKAKFNEDLATAMGKTPQGGMMAQMLKSNDFATVDPASISYAMRGETVLISLPGSPMPMEAVQVEGQWKMGLGAAEGMAAMALPLMEKMSTSAAELAAKVEAGEFADSGAAADAFLKSIMSAMQGMGGG